MSAVLLPASQDGWSLLQADLDRRSPIFGSSQIFGGELDSSLENDMIKLIRGLFPTYDADGTEAGIEYVVSHGVDDDLKPVVLP